MIVAATASTVFFRFLAFFLDTHSLFELHTLSHIVFMYISAQGFIDLDLDKIAVFLHFQIF